MGNFTDKNLHNIFGCPNSNYTDVVNVVGASGCIPLEPNEIYRFTSTVDCFISIDAGPSGLKTSASGVRIFPCVPEMFSTTGDLIWLSTLQDTEGGALPGYLTVTQMLGRSA